MHDIAKQRWDEAWERFEAELKEFQDYIKRSNAQMNLEWHEHLEEQERQRQSMLKFIREV